MADELRIVYITNSDFDARVVAGLLETEGIPVLVQQEPAGSALGITVGILGEVKVVVRPQDYQRALDILNSVEDDTLLSDGDESAQPDPE